MNKSTHRAFTLLELAVVVGVIAVVGAILIPMTMQMRAQLGDITCQNNLRQLGRALEMFNVDHSGSMPYGLFFIGSGPPTWVPPNGNFHKKISWVSEINPYLSSSELSPAFRCPDAQQQAGEHDVSYVMNFIVGVTPYYEILIGGVPPRAQTKPPKIHLMRSEGTALIWDTAIRPDPFYEEGYLTGLDIDGQRFWDGAISPQYRYFQPNDPFGRIPPGSFGNNRPIRLNVGSYVYRNVDPQAEPWFAYQGNLRFRHNDQTRCNVAFSDGSVRQFTATIGANNTVTAHNAIRRYFMINWPPGVTPDPAVPHIGGPGGVIPVFPRRPKANQVPPKGSSIEEKQ